MTSTEHLKAAANRVFEMINGHKPELAESVMHPEFVTHRQGMGKSFPYFAQTTGGPGAGAGVDTSDPFAGFKAAFGAILVAFPDMRNNVVGAQIAEGDTVVSHITFTGTHLGPFLGFPGTGRSVEMDEVLFMRVVDDKVKEVWSLGDELGLLEQLGVLTPPGR
jgi:predicted ester cyclase